MTASERHSLGFLLNPAHGNELEESFGFPSSGHRGMFVLRDEPYEIQRKSYRNENRYLRPHPLVVQHNTQEQVDGWIEVSLVCSNGQDFPFNEEKVLECNGGNRQYLKNNHSCRFSIKINHEGAFRLRFHIVYSCSSGRFEESLYSRPFIVRANQRNIQVLPLISAFYPSSGPEGTEIWIKGKGYSSSKTVVTFNNVPAKIVEVKKTLIVVKVPGGLIPGPVILQVSNVYKGTVLSSKSFTFNYLSIVSSL